MYKVLIVDDEKFVIKSLIATINWNEFNFEIVGQASNGIKAFEYIIDLKPDLVFTDVKMPGLGGLELIKKVNEASLKVLFVVISGYADFNYVQNAMNYGAMGYCLKPFNENEIINILLKAANVLNAKKASLEAKLLGYIDDMSHEGKCEASEIFESLGFEYSEGRNILILASIGVGKVCFPGNTKYINLKIGSTKNVYLLEASQYNYIKEFIAASFPENVKGIGVSVSLCLYEEMSKSIDNAIIKAYNYFITSSNGLFEKDILSQIEFNSSILQLENVIDNRDIPSIKKVLNSLMVMFAQNIFDIRHALRIYNLIMSFLYSMNTVKYEDYIHKYEQLIGMFDNVQHMFAYLMELLSKQITLNGEHCSEEIRNEMFKNILAYVNENYCKDISIQSISQKFIVNPSYLCQLFRKNVNITFTDYLTRMRILSASNLLKTTKLLNSEIAERVGYDDYHYFARVFKKVTRKTLSEFRTEAM